MMGAGKLKISEYRLRSSVLRMLLTAMLVLKNCSKYYMPAQGLPMMPALTL